MLLIQHTIIGAAVGQALEGKAYGALAAFTLGLFSHYLLDAIPHLDRIDFWNFRQHFKTSEPLKKWPKMAIVSAFTDATVVLIFFIMFVGRFGNFNLSDAVVWGIIGSALPDLLDNVPFWNKLTRQIPLLKTEYGWHRYFHYNQESEIENSNYVFGVIAQIAIIILGVWLLFIR